MAIASHGLSAIAEFPYLYMSTVSLQTICSVVLSTMQAVLTPFFLLLNQQLKLGSCVYAAASECLNLCTFRQNSGLRRL